MEIPGWKGREVSESQERQKSDISDSISVHNEGRINHAQTLSGSVICPKVNERGSNEGDIVAMVGRNHHRKHLNEQQRNFGSIFKQD